MKLEPFIRLDDIPFAATRADIIARHGVPPHEEHTPSGLTVLDFGDAIYRFLGDGSLDEISKPAKNLTLGSLIVPFPNLVSVVRLQDRGAFDRLGFLISPRYGLAFIPYKRFWITALSRRAVLRWKGF